MALNMLLLYIFSFFIGSALIPIVIHQFGLFSMLADPKTKEMLKDPNSEISKIMATLWTGYSHSFRTYKHGAFHGTLSAITLALPLIATGAVFEQKGFKYVMITWGFWLINFILMGAVLCHFIALDFTPGSM